MTHFTNSKNIVWIHEKGANKFWNWKSKIHWYHPIFWLANISYTFYWSIRKRGGPVNFTFSELFRTIFTYSCYKSHLLVYVRGLWQSLSLLNPTQVAGNKVNHDFHRESISHLGKGWNCHPDWLEEDYFHLFYRSIANNLKVGWCTVMDLKIITVMQCYQDCKNVPVTVANILNLVSSLVQSLWDCLNGLVMVISGLGYESGSTQL